MRLTTCCFVILCVAFGCGKSDKVSLLDGSVRTPAGEITTGGSVGVLRLLPGDCFLGLIDEIEVVDAVPCAEDHQAEVFAIFNLAGTKWPGTSSVAQTAKSGCLERFRNATGLVFDPTHMIITGYAPSERSWKDDRSVLCAVTPHDSALVRGRLTLRYR